MVDQSQLQEKLLSYLDVAPSVANDLASRIMANAKADGRWVEMTYDDVLDVAADVPLTAGALSQEEIEVLALGNTDSIAIKEEVYH